MPKPNKTIKSAVDQLDQLNKKFPSLSSSQTIETVDKLRALFEKIEATPKKPAIAEQPESAAPDTELNFDINYQLDKNTKSSTTELSQALIEDIFNRHPIDSAFSYLKQKFPHLDSLRDLLALTDGRFYIRALRKEAIEFQSNQISIPQIAEIWMDMDRPPVGDERWTERTVSMILG